VDVVRRIKLVGMRVVQIIVVVVVASEVMLLLILLAEEVIVDKLLGHVVCISLPIFLVFGLQLSLDNL
jgi:hypothetical protein